MTDVKVARIGARKEAVLTRVDFRVAHVAVKGATISQQGTTFHLAYLGISELSLPQRVMEVALDLDSLALAALEAEVLVALGTIARETWLISRDASLAIRTSQDELLKLAHWDTSQGRQVFPLPPDLIVRIEAYLLLQVTAFNHVVNVSIFSYIVFFSSLGRW